MGFTDTRIDHYVDKAVAAEERGDLESARFFASLANAKALADISHALHGLNLEPIGRFTDGQTND
ncbi:hypothetical protein Q8791_21920 [Nocardiopsis sp. CT-R113]|uniref:Transcriptional regulator n=1 Tax=Nocardiopsis codii TaxID=3065942 RepID=A0ABU7KCC0_9ACTN|nr:hypothetical protein [Nocardiopsis sp. CT-R113]MEE2039876.1 hypothetical protein [Nocardiopsis sp. CT-R113]